jgi:hypothetical protein
VYSTCLFCHQSLGANERIEHFPVGRRLAFDAAKGRLWVICPRCLRWNLTPLEERWEAVEECERLFRTAKLREQTDQIALARLHAGLDLVRVGRPLRPEFAAWRYGRRLRQRWRRHLVRVGARTFAAGGAIAGLAASGAFAWLSGISNPASLAQIVLLGGVWGLPLAHAYAMYIRGRIRFFTVPSGEGRPAQVCDADLEAAHLYRRSEREPWSLRFRLGARQADFRGPLARQVLGVFLARLNAAGAARGPVHEATMLLERHGAGGRYIDWLTTRPLKTVLSEMDVPQRLALEMSVHEEAEQRALEGEMSELEAAWSEAEEIARIADDLLVPDTIHDRLRSLAGKERIPAKEQ